jgi:hypothetical protein
MFGKQRAASTAVVAIVDFAGIVTNSATKQQIPALDEEHVNKTLLLKEESGE